MKVAVAAYLAVRRSWGHQGSRRGASTGFAVAGIAVGVTALTVVLGVMNGFQLGFIDDILEVGSYHVQVTAAATSDGHLVDVRDWEQTVMETPGVAAAVAFAETQALAEGTRVALRGMVIRAVPPDVAVRDPGFAHALVATAGSIDLTTDGTVVMGAELASRLGLQPGGTLALQVLDLGQGLGAATVELTVSGLFRTGYYDYDLGWGFVSWDTWGTVFPASATTATIGVKLHDRFRDQQTVQRLRAALPDEVQVESWRAYNRSFFAALRMEKLLLQLLLGSIFVVVGFNAYQTFRRKVTERQAELGVLKAMGATNGLLRASLLVEGGMVGLGGALLGVAAGLLVAQNVDAVFRIAEVVLTLGADAVALTLGTTSRPVSIFSPTTFYLTRVPSQVLLVEQIGICAFGIASPAAAALLAAARIGRIHPAILLRGGVA